MKILLVSLILIGSTSVFGQHCVDSTSNKQTQMNCCTNGVKMPEDNKKGCCANQNAANASTPNGNCPKPTPAKVKAVKAVAKPKED